MPRLLEGRGTHRQESPSVTTPEAHTDTARVIGVDVGGTKILAAVVSGDGLVGMPLERRTEVSSEEALLAMLDGLVEELRAGRAVASVNIPLTDVDFRDWMRDRHRLPVGIDNDANAAAIAEWRAGAARGASDVVMLTIGTGVGGGLILAGKPYRGATGSGAELGHIVLELDGPPCRCGGRGHLESFAAGPAADRAASELYGPGSSAHELIRKAQAGEAEAVDALARIGRYLGAGIATFVNVFEPELIVIGGGFGEAARQFVTGPAREVLAQNGLSPGRETVRIVEAQLGSDAGVIGAGMLAFEALGQGH
jgi:glucokinase